MTCQDCYITICIPECPERSTNCNMSSTGCPLQETTLFDVEDRENNIGGNYERKIKSN